MAGKLLFIRNAPPFKNITLTISEQKARGAMDAIFTTLVFPAPEQECDKA